MDILGEKFFYFPLQGATSLPPVLFKFPEWICLLSRIFCLEGGKPATMPPGEGNRICPSTPLRSLIYRQLYALRLLSWWIFRLRYSLSPVLPPSSYHSQLPFWNWSLPVVGFRVLCKKQREPLSKSRNFDYNKGKIPRSNIFNQKESRANKGRAAGPPPRRPVK